MSNPTDLAILATIAQELNREVDTTRALRTALVHIVALFGLQTGWIWLYNEGSDEPYLAAAHALPPALTENPAHMNPCTWCYCLDSYEKGDMEGAANVNIITCTRLKGLVGGTEGLRFHASVPLYAYAKKLGVLNVASAEWRELADDQLRLLYAVGDMVSMAVERGRLFDRSHAQGAEAERVRLARELHDTVAQGLTAITLQLEAADALTEGGTASADLVASVRSRVQTALLLARATLDETRRSVQNLRAAALAQRPFAEALEQLGRDYAARWGLSFHYSKSLSAPLPPPLEEGLFRVAQELMTNVVRHAEATTLRVSIEATPTLVRLIVADDGRGFDPAAVAAGHYGLIGVRERVRLLGGTLTIRSGTGRGTQVEVEIDPNFTR